VAAKSRDHVTFLMLSYSLRFIHEYPGVGKHNGSYFHVKTLKDKRLFLINLTLSRDPRDPRDLE